MRPKVEITTGALVGMSVKLATSPATFPATRTDFSQNHMESQLGHEWLRSPADEYLALFTQDAITGFKYKVQCLGCHGFSDKQILDLRSPLLQKCFFFII